MLDKVTDKAWIKSRLEHRILGWWYRNVAQHEGIDIIGSGLGYVAHP